MTQKPRMNVELAVHPFLIYEQIKVSGQHHAAAVLPHRKEPPLFIEEEGGWTAQTFN